MAHFLKKTLKIEHMISFSFYLTISQEKTIIDFSSFKTQQNTIITDHYFCSLFLAFATEAYLGSIHKTLWIHKLQICVRSC